VVPVELHRALARPDLQATVADLEWASAVLVLDCEPVDDAPVLDLRLRKGVRRHALTLAVASSRPSSLDPNAARSVRLAPGAGEALLAALDAALTASGDVEGLAAAAGTPAEDVRALAELLSGAGGEVVIVWGERLATGPRAAQAVRALLNVAARLGLAGTPGAGLLELPSGGNGRGLREVGVLPNAGPGFTDAPAEGRSADGIAAALAEGTLSTLYLLHADPLPAHPDRGLWERALARATTVIAHESLMTETVRTYADVVFPAESYAEKEGTLTHPDGRLQRLRPAIGQAAEVRAEWRVLADLAERIGHPLDVLTGAQATAQVAEAVPFYAGITRDEIGGRGVNWQSRDAAGALPEGDAGPFELERPPAAPSPNGALRLATFRSIWASKEVEASPALRFLAPEQRVQLSPQDAQRLGLSEGDPVAVRHDAAVVRGTAVVHAAVPSGTVLLELGTVRDSANALTNGGRPLVEVQRA
jgi:NADH-quinone oxidoreductase subunit G